MPDVFTVFLNKDDNDDDDDELDFWNFHEKLKGKCTAYIRYKASR